MMITFVESLCLHLQEISTKNLDTLDHKKTSKHDKTDTDTKSKIKFRG